MANRELSSNSYFRPEDIERASLLEITQYLIDNDLSITGIPQELRLRVMNQLIPGLSSSFR